jgi:hypothetical protein
MEMTMRGLMVRLAPAMNPESALLSELRPNSAVEEPTHTGVALAGGAPSCERYLR